VILHVLNGLWARIDGFGMILAWNINGWLVINVGMRLVCVTSRLDITNLNNKNDEVNNKTSFIITDVPKTREN